MYHVNQNYIQANCSVIVTCDKSMKDKVEAFLSHFAIYLEDFFGIVILEAFNQEYKESMTNFTFCHTKKCTVKIISSATMYCGSSIATNDSDNHLGCMLA